MGAAGTNCDVSRVSAFTSYSPNPALDPKSNRADGVSPSQPKPFGDNPTGTG